MTRWIDFRIGVARSAPYRVQDRLLPPSGVVVPRPFDVRHLWRGPMGRSTGGAYFRTNYEAMDWVYSVGVEGLYRTFLDRYDPVNPWVWLHIYDLHTDEGAWFEASMLEPRVSRGGAIVINNLVIPFIHVTRYTP